MTSSVSKLICLKICYIGGMTSNSYLILCYPKLSIMSGLSFMIKLASIFALEVSPSRILPPPCRLWWPLPSCRTSLPLSTLYRQDKVRSQLQQDRTAVVAKGIENILVSLRDFVIQMMMLAVAGDTARYLLSSVIQTTPLPANDHNV